MTDELKMPERREEDGACSVEIIDDYISIKVTTAGREEALLISPFNAWRVFGFLALMLGIPLTKKAGKAIVFTTPGKKLDTGFEGRIKFASKTRETVFHLDSGEKDQ